MTEFRFAGSVDGQGGWNPKALTTTLVAWYDASATNGVVSDANGVSQWTDLSGNARHATQTTNTNKPSFSNNRISFGGDDWLNATSISASTLSRVVAAIYSNNTTAAGSEPLTSSTGTGGWDFGRASTGSGVTVGSMYLAKSGVAYIGSSGSTTLANGVDYVVTGRTTTSTWRISINGTAFSGSHSQTLTAGSTLRIGTWSTSTTYRLNGSIRELIIANPMVDADLQRLEGYLAHKWGFAASLPVSHPYRYAKP